MQLVAEKFWDEIFAYKGFGGVTVSRDAAWRALLTCQ